MKLCSTMRMELFSIEFHNILCPENALTTPQNHMILYRQNHQNSGRNFVHFVKSFSGIFLKKSLQFPEQSCIIANVVTLIAVKREVAAWKWQVFRGANVKL